MSRHETCPSAITSENHRDASSIQGRGGKKAAAGSGKLAAQLLPPQPADFGSLNHVEKHRVTPSYIEQHDFVSTSRSVLYFARAHAIEI
jgi:hypothetical protein